jgi:hypothetical protein
VRNGLKDLRLATLTAFGAWISLPAVAAQGAPTAEGAQQFLATTAKKVVTHVYFVEASGRMNYVTGKYTGQVRTIKGGAFGKPKETVAALPERVIDRSVNDIHASVLEAIDAYGRPTACATRITEVVAEPYDEAKSDSGNDSHAFSFTLTYTDEQWKYEPLTKFMSPAQVLDWSDVRIVRSPQGWVTVMSTGQSFARVELTYMTVDPDVADRIEYAMKFLAMSCARSASTGF